MRWRATMRSKALRIKECEKWRTHRLAMAHLPFSLDLLICSGASGRLEDQICDRVGLRNQ
jgi:hypothetical protein